MMRPRRFPILLQACAVVFTFAMAQGSSLADDDFERRAAQAAQTERGFYESGGARDTSVIPNAQPAARAPTHIEEADRKVADREAARRAAERAAEDSKVARLADQLETSRVHHGAILRGLDEQRASLAAELASAERAGAADRARTLKSQLAAVDDALAAKQNEVARYEARLQTEITKAQAEPRAAEEARRITETTELASRLRTQEAQIEAGNAAFEERIGAIDAAIDQARSNGLNEVAEQLEQTRRKTVDAQQAFLAGQEATRGASRRDLDRAYAANRADGIGPTSTVGLESAIRRAAITTGNDPASAVNLVDHAAVDSTAASAARAASGAPASTEHVSIFNDINSESLRDFALDYAAEARTTYGSWEGFKGRVLEGYVAGVGKGALDAVKGLFDVVVGLGDLTGEALEDALERLTGAELDVFGDEKMRVVRDMLESGARLYGTDDQAGLEEARKLLATADAIQTLLRRKAEQMAGSGEKGIRESINIVGQAAPQVLGAEELAVRGAVAVTRAAGVGARVVTGVAKADAAADAARATGAATDAARAGDAATGTGATAGAAPAIRTGPEATAPTVRMGPEATAPTVRMGPEATAPTIRTGPEATAPTVLTGPDGAPTGTGRTNLDESPTALNGERGTAEPRPASGLPPPARGPPLQADAVLVRPDGSATLVMEDGRQFPLGKEVGRGSTTTVYEVPGRDGIVVKVTTGGADALDDAGYKVIKGLDPHGDVIEVPTIHRQYEGTDIRSIDGAETGVVTVTDKAPTDFKRATDIQRPGGGMTPGQISAYRRAMDKLNDQGFVWLDSKNDNYTFRKVTGADGDEWRLVVVDPGGIVPMKGRDPDAARALQRALDTPSEASRAAPEWEVGRGVQSGRILHHEDLAARFDDLVDWEAIQNLTGKPYNSLGRNARSRIPWLSEEIFPFNPRNGFDYPELPEALNAPVPAPTPAPAPVRTGGVPPVDRSAPTAPDTNAASVAPTPVPADTPRAMTHSGTEDTAAVRTPGASLLSGAAGATALTVGGGFALQQIIEPIFFEFGGGKLPPYIDFKQTFGDTFIFEIEQVFHITGNNPFNPTDPLGGQEQQPAGCSGSQPPSDTQTLSCPAGQNGSITQVRAYSCVGTALTPGSYQTTSNTCAAPPATGCPGSQPPNETQTLSCPAGQTGSITQLRTYSCVGTAWAPGDWLTTSNTCAAPAGCPGSQPPNETQTLSCPAGQIGSITQVRAYSCVGTAWTPGSYQTTSNTCTTPAPTGCATNFSTGNYACGGECGIGSVGLSVTPGSNTMTASPFGANSSAQFSCSGSSAASQSSNLIILGAPGHTCTLGSTGILTAFGILCQNSGGGSCNSSCSR